MSKDVKYSQKFENQKLRIIGVSERHEERVIVIEIHNPYFFGVSHLTHRVRVQRSDIKISKTEIIEELKYLLSKINWRKQRLDAKAKITRNSILNDIENL